MSRTLLLADGSAAVHRLVELMFSGEAVDVIAVDDGLQAIERLPVEQPDIVLADIATAGRTGYEVAAFVKDHPRLSRTPVLLLAGAFEPVDEARVRQAGAAGVLVKPLSPHDVVARVRALLETCGPAVATAATQAEKPAAPPPAAGTPAGSLDDYFERLDAAFASLEARRASALRAAADPPAAAEVASGAADIPTLDAVLGAAGQVPAPGDELAERIANRVAERLGTDAVRDVVAEAVSEVAGQLARRDAGRTGRS